MALLRAATAADLDALRALDTEAFPPDRLDREPAHPGELERGLERGQFTVAEIEGRVVGMLQTEILNDDHVYMVALAVAEQSRGAGVGRALVKHFINMVDAISPTPSATTVTSPMNVPMIALLTASGFVVRSGMRDYFGPGKDRVYCQLRTRRQVVDPDDRVLIPVEAVDHLFELLRREESAITAVIRSVQGTFFEISEFEPEHRQGLKADETAISVAEAAGIVAALTFLLGLSFGVPNYSEPLRTLILVATILAIGSLQIYANASGSLSRIRDDSFEAHMKWGNLLLEFGGLYPLVVVLPAVFNQVSANLALSITTAVAVAIAIFAYEHSPFSISGRYSRGPAFQIFALLTALLPLAAAPLYLLTGHDTIWVILVGVLMAARLAWLIPGDRRELSARSRPTPRLLGRVRRGEK